MAKLTRVPAKVFAASAAADEIGQFGSAVAGSKLETADVATIQGLSAWLSGWSEALVSGNRYPALQEMNGAMKVLSYQGAYALQEGIPEYDASTTYYIGSIVKKTGTFELYGSLTDDNVGNALTVDTEWQLLVNLADIGGGGVVDFENYGEVTTNLTLLENKISTAYFSGTNTITLPTITDTAKQVTCILDFTTASSGQPTITNTNLKWSDKNGGKAPTAYSIVSGVQNLLVFKSVWISSVLYWEVEYTTYGGVVTTFIRPNLTSNGTLGGSTTAISATNGFGGNTDFYKMVDGNTSTVWVAGSSAFDITYYSPTPLKVSSLTFTTEAIRNIRMETGNFYGSNDGATWVFISSFTNSTNDNYTLTVGSNEFYKYTKLSCTSATGAGGGYLYCNEMGINAIYIAT